MLLGAQSRFLVREIVLGRHLHQWSSIKSLNVGFVVSDLLLGLRGPPTGGTPNNYNYRWVDVCLIADLKPTLVTTPSRGSITPIGGYITPGRGSN